MAGGITPSTNATSTMPNSGSSGGSGGVDEGKFDAVLARMDASAEKKSERDAKTTEHKDVNGSMTNAARSSAN